MNSPVNMQGDDLGGRAFALFLRPHPGAFRKLMCPHLREFAHFFQKNANARGLARGGRGGGAWALLELTDALLGLKPSGHFKVNSLFHPFCRESIPIPAMKPRLITVISCRLRRLHESTFAFGDEVVMVSSQLCQLRGDQSLPEFGVNSRRRFGQIWDSRLLRLDLLEGRAYVLPIRSDEGLALETSAFESLYGG